jgi:LysR family transcriptional regulator, glycine cleavage system transcriptional activator
MLRSRIPSTNSLFTFETVARLRSFSEAASELNVTQPAISRAINALETHLGYTLFNRHGRWIELTYNGDKLFRATSTAFNTVSDSLREIEQRKENQETVTISMSPVAVNYWFIPRMHEFRLRFPTINLNFKEYGTSSDTFAREVDLNIRLSNPRDADMHRWPFADERIIALCSPEYFATHGALDKMIPGGAHSFIEWQQERYGLDEFFHATGLQITKNPLFARFTDYSSVVHAAIQGQGVALSWITESSRQIIEGTLVPACAQVVKTGRRYHILASNLNPMRPIVEDVRNWLINEMRSDEKKVTAILKESWDLF